MRSAVVIVTVVLSLLGGCTRSSDPSSQRHSSPSSREAGVFNWGVKSRVVTIDPHEISDDVTASVMRQVYEGLTTINERGVPQPSLAVSWVPNDDSTEFLFTLRRGIRFTDGSPLDAAAVKASFERLKSARLRSAFAKSLVADVREIKVIESNRVLFRLSRPVASFPARLAYPGLAVVGKSARTPDSVTDVKKVAGTGPFRLTEYAGERVTLEARKNYHSSGPYLDRIVVRTVADDATRFNMARTGALDLALLSPMDGAAARKDEELNKRLKLTPRNGVVYLQMQPGAYPPFKDPKVRRAFARAIDRDRLVDDVLAGIPMRVDGFVPPGIPGADASIPNMTYAVAESKALLDAAGYGSGLPPLKITVANEGAAKRAAEAIAADLSTNLGIQVGVEALAPEAIRERNRRGELPLYLTGWFGDYSHPDDYLPMLFGSKSPENRSGYQNPAVDRLFAKAASIEEANVRDDIYQEAHLKIMEATPGIPLYTPVEAELVGEDVKGLIFGPFGHLGFAQVTKERS